MNGSLDIDYAPWGVKAARSKTVPMTIPFIGSASAIEYFIDFCPAVVHPARTASGKIATARLESLRLKIDFRIQISLCIKLGKIAPRLERQPREKLKRQRRTGCFFQVFRCEFYGSTTAVVCMALYRGQHSR